MPCACKNSPIDVPDGTEWGPIFWRLLHALAERVGTVPMVGLRGDEVRAWKSLLTTMDKALPCEHCREHLKFYITNNPVAIPEDYTQIHEWIRRWIYNLHEEVNRRLGKVAFPFDSLDLIYRAVSPRATNDVLNVLVARSIRGTAVPLLSWNNWNKHVKILQGMYN